MIVTPFFVSALSIAAQHLSAPLSDTAFNSQFVTVCYFYVYQYISILSDVVEDYFESLLDQPRFSQSVLQA